LLLLSLGAARAYGQPAAAQCPDRDCRSANPPARLTPQPAIRSTLELFGVYPLIMFAETHSAHEEHEFLRQLVADPAFPDVADDVVVEFGNARYQPVIDRYVLALEDVPAAELRQVWRNTTQLGPDSWDAPMYEQFFHHVRAVNEKLAPSRRIRVLLGDPPIDWQQVHTPEDFMPFLEQRDPHFANVILTEVLAKGRKAVVIAGALHLIHQEHRPGEPKPFPTVTSIIEAAHPGKVFVLSPFTGGLFTPGLSECTIDSRFLKWPSPSIARVEGTWLGEILALDLDTPDGRVIRHLQDLIDAIVYLGQPNTLREATRTYAYYTEQPEYVQELKRRRTITMGEPLDPETIKFHKLGHPAEEMPPPPPM
jgi:hypothetical protein